MVSWAWLVIVFFVGALFGILLEALIAISKEDEQTKRKWWEE